MILFHHPDIEISSIILNNGLKKEILNKMILELKFFLFIMPIDECILITPSIRFESHEFIKIIIRDFSIFVERQYIKLFTDQPDLETLIESERESNKYARNIPRFNKAYFRSKKKLKAFNIALEPRGIKRVGQQSLEKCINYLNSFLQRHELTKEQIRSLNSFKGLTIDSAQNAFLWSLVKEKAIEKSNLSDNILKMLNFQWKMSESYLETLATSKVIIPSDKGIGNTNSLLHTNEKVYNFFRLERLFSSLKMYERIYNANECQLLRWKYNPDIMRLCDDIRQKLKVTNDTGNIIKEIFYKYEIEKLLTNAEANDMIKGEMAKDNKMTYRDIFVVHGRNETIKAEVQAALLKMKLNPIILHEQANRGKTIIEKIEKHSNVSAAIILFTADDIGKLRTDIDLEQRARQNVIFEAGYFMGKLGREKTIILLENSLKFPSDLDGIAFIPLDENKRWVYDLAKELRDIGFDVDSNNL